MGCDCGIEGPLLGEEQRSALDSFIGDSTVDCGAILEYLGGFISKGVSDGRFTEREAHRDLEIALWVAYACNNYGDYEHSYTACQWLADVEDVGRGHGVWCYRYANALMYCGKPCLALEYCERGVAADPAYPWTWLTLGRLRSHFGDRRGAETAAMEGLALEPGNHEFLTLLADIETGVTLEQMEMHFIDPADDSRLASAGEDDREYAAKRMWVDGIVCDRENLGRIKDRLRVVGWSPDHPYCTFLRDWEGGSFMVTFQMNEALISKFDPDSLAARFDALPDMDSKARTHLAERVAGRHLLLAGFCLSPNLSVRLTYTSNGSEDVYTVDLGPDMEVVDDTAGGPFAAMVLLRDPDWDPAATAVALEEVWGMRLEGPEIGDDTLIAAVGGNILAVSLIRGPVPGEEAQDAASGNYMWPDGREEVSTHTAHLIVALVNHEGDPVECGLTFAKLVDCCLRTSDAVGVYENETVYQPRFFSMEMDSLRTRDVLPVMVMIWIGMYRTSEGVCAYTNGLRSYARDEIEVIDADDESFNVMNFVYDVVYHSFATGTVYRDGDTFGFEPDQTLSVTRSRGVSVDGYTLKLEYPGRR